jgi:hypothetical protein
LQTSSSCALPWQLQQRQNNMNRHAAICAVVGNRYGYNDKCVDGRKLKWDVRDMPKDASAEVRNEYAMRILAKLKDAGIKNIVRVEVVHSRTYWSGWYPAWCKLCVVVGD